MVVLTPGSKQEMKVRISPWNKNSMLAMILVMVEEEARLHELTNKAVASRWLWRRKLPWSWIFLLSNCANSGIDVVGVLTVWTQF